MAFEVAEELVIVCGEVADRIVAFGGGVYYRLGVVREASEVSTVFF